MNKIKGEIPDYEDSKTTPADVKDPMECECLYWAGSWTKEELQQEKRHHPRCRYVSELSKWQKCPICEGTGSTPFFKECDVCKGKRIISTITGKPPEDD